MGVHVCAQKVVFLNKFQALGLSESVVRPLELLGFDNPTPIQTQAIPVVLSGRDVMGLAQTGTGKTAAFGLPIIHHLMDMLGRPAPRTTKSLILAPTRELVTQIAVNLRTFTKGTPIKVNSVVGGMSIQAQVKQLSFGSDILVATPGRLLDLVKRQAIRLDSAKFLVLDEADQMLDLGFIHVLREISQLVAKQRQTLLFSATMNKQMADIASAFLKDPVRVEVASQGRAADKVVQSVYYVEGKEKTELLKTLLGKNPDDLSLVFARTKHGAEKLMKSLVDIGFKAGSIHGNKSQGNRDRTLKAFRNREINVLVATDVAARGIDIHGVTHVYNFELPEVAENYVHRIGRTARAGADGQAVAFCSEAEYGLLRAIEKVMNITIETVGGTRPTKAVKFTPPARNQQKPRRSNGPAGAGNGEKRFGGDKKRSEGANKPYDPIKGASRRNAQKKRSSKNMYAA